MPVRKLNKALEEIEDAQNILREVKLNIPDDKNIQRVTRKLDDAESLVRNAIREVKYG